MHATDLLSVPQLAWGIDAQILAAAIVIIAYAILFTEKINRAVIALLAASVMIFSGILTQSEALKGIDFNTLALLIGMMTIVGYNRFADCARNFSNHSQTKGQSVSLFDFRDFCLQHRRHGHSHRRPAKHSYRLCLKFKFHGLCQRTDPGRRHNHAGLNPRL